MLVELKDGGIVDINLDFRDTDEDSGCPTCGWYTNYVREMRLYYTKFSVLYDINCIEFSESDIMSILIGKLDEIRQLTEDECDDFMVLEISKRLEGCGSLTHTKTFIQ